MAVVVMVELKSSRTFECRAFDLSGGDALLDGSRARLQSGDQDAAGGLSHRSLDGRVAG